MKAFVSCDLLAVAVGIIMRRDDFILKDAILEDVSLLGCVEDLLLESFGFQTVFPLVFSNIFSAVSRTFIITQ